MSLIYRVDDFPGVKPEEFWKHNLESLKRFDAVMEANGVEEYYLGVIPKHVTQEQLEWIATCPRIVTALHGIEHDERFPNEFREWQTTKDIRQAISAAVARLNPLVGPVDSYIPPHNVIDRKTLDALRQCGFKTLFLGPGSDPSIFISAQLPLLHHVGSFKFIDHPGFETYYSGPDGVMYGRTDELMVKQYSMDHIKYEMQSHNPHCLTLHFTWEVNIGLENLDLFLKELKKPWEKRS